MAGERPVATQVLLPVLLLWEAQTSGALRSDLVAPSICSWQMDLRALLVVLGHSEKLIDGNMSM